jgi:hypothetical protein
MAARFTQLTCLASVAMLAFLSSANAAPSQPGVVGARPVQQTVASTAAAKPAARERAVTGREFSAKWGNYVQRVYGVEADVWARRMAPSLAQADAGNLRNALARDTFEGAMAELGGTGMKLSDDQAIEALATGGGSTPQVLGAVANDLVYTPIAPCRILDTRSTAAGRIAANSTRSFVAINASNFTSQGGSATNCNTLGLSATAVAINLTAVAPSIAGYATAYPFGTAQPLAASVNYTAGAIVNNALIVQIPNPLSSFDFTIYTFGQSHFVADIVGFFAPPLATPLQCVETANTDLVITASGGTGNAVAPACATGYTQTATNCETTSWLMPIVYFQSGTCSARNGDSTSQTLRASRTCCRIPGR